LLPDRFLCRPTKKFPFRVNTTSGRFDALDFGQNLFSLDRFRDPDFNLRTKEGISFFPTFNLKVDDFNLWFSSGPNPMTSIYNASVVNFYNATGSPARFENINIEFYML
jgi:hypothetical protein